MKFVVVVLIGALVFAAAPSVQACAGCRNPNLPINRLNAVQLGPGEIRASATMAATTLHVVHEAGCPDLSNCTDVPVQPLFNHDQRIHPGELRAIAEVGISRIFGFELQVPVRVVATSIEYTTPEGAPYQPLDPGVHHRDETLVGLGDPWLLLRAGGLTNGWLLQGRVGLSLPIGRTEENPFALGDKGERHQHIQFGNGTFDPVVALDTAKRVGWLNLTGYAQAQMSVYENKHGFRGGGRFLGGVQAAATILGNLMGGLGLDVLHDGPERWDGEIQQDGNLGRTELLGGMSGTYSWQRTSVTVGARFPLVRRLIVGNEPPGRLSSPLAMSLTVSHAFGR